MNTLSTNLQEDIFRYYMEISGNDRKKAVEIFTKQLDSWLFEQFLEPRRPSMQQKATEMGFTDEDSFLEGIETR